MLISCLGGQAAEQLEQLSDGADFMEIGVVPKIWNALHLFLLVSLLLLAWDWLLYRDGSTSLLISGQHSCKERNTSLLLHLWLWCIYHDSVH